jgi:hypothetical protein
MPLPHISYKKSRIGCRLFGGVDTGESHYCGVIRRYLRCVMPFCYGGGASKISNSKFEHKRASESRAFAHSARKLRRRLRLIAGETNLAENPVHQVIDPVTFSGQISNRRGVPNQSSSDWH